MTNETSKGFARQLLNDIKTRLSEYFVSDTREVESLERDIAALIDCQDNERVSATWLKNDEGNLVCFTELECRDQSIQDMSSKKLERYDQEHSKIYRIEKHFARQQSKYKHDISELIKQFKQTLNANEISIWQKLRDEYNSVVENRPMSIDRIGLQFPQLKRSKVLEIDSCFESLKILRLKMKSLQQHHKRNKDLHMSETRDVYAKVKEIYSTEEENTKELEMQMNRTMERHEKLAHLRRSKLVEISHQESRDTEERRNLEIEQRRISDSIKTTRDKQKRAISLFQQARADFEREEEDGYQQFARDIRYQNELEEDYRLKRIAYRKDRETDKIQIAQEKQRKEKHAQKQRIERLESLRATVSVDIQADWERILAETESMMNSQRLGSAHDTRRDFAPLNLSDAKVMKDPRAKLTNELQLRGLLQNSYARDMLGQLQIKPATHLVSTFKIE
jgi:hypothetical protein